VVDFFLFADGSRAAVLVHSSSDPSRGTVDTISSVPPILDVKEKPLDLLQNFTVKLTSGRDWREFFEERYGAEQQMSEISLIDELAQVWVVVDVAKDEHVAKLPVMRLVLTVSYADVHVILTRARCHECWSRSAARAHCQMQSCSSRRPRYRSGNRS
jgi:hypothetical protein